MSRMSDMACLSWLWLQRCMGCWHAFMHTWAGCGVGATCLLWSQLSLVLPALACGVKLPLPLHDFHVEHNVAASLHCTLVPPCHG
jgi:hypothetical protein